MSVKAKLFAGPGVALTVLLVVSYFGTTGAGKAGGYIETDLVTNTTDSNLVNAWGLTSTPTSQFWISDNGTGLTTTLCPVILR
jgi:hypothetical protein